MFNCLTLHPAFEMRMTHGTICAFEELLKLSYGSHCDPDQALTKDECINTHYIQVHVDECGVQLSRIPVLLHITTICICTCLVWFILKEVFIVTK